MTWLTRLREVGEAATPGQWHVHLTRKIAHVMSEERYLHEARLERECGEQDARFIVLSHNAWPLIVAALEAAEGLDGTISAQVKLDDRLAALKAAVEGK